MGERHATRGNLQSGFPIFLSFEFLVSSFKSRVQGVGLRVFETRNFETYFLSCTLQPWISSTSAVELPKGATAPARAPCSKPLGIPTRTSVSLSSAWPT